jgi:hypothetical protein
VSKHHHLVRNGQVIAVLTDDDFRLTPELAAHDAEDLDRRAVTSLCHTLLEARSITGEFMPVGIGLNPR